MVPSQDMVHSQVLMVTLPLQPLMLRHHHTVRASQVTMAVGHMVEVSQGMEHIVTMTSRQVQQQPAKGIVVSHLMVSHNQVRPLMLKVTVILVMEALQVMVAWRVMEAPVVLTGRIKAVKI